MQNKKVSILLIVLILSTCFASCSFASKPAVPFQNDELGYAIEMSSVFSSSCIVVEQQSEDCEIVFFVNSRMYDSQEDSYNNEAVFAIRAYEKSEYTSEDLPQTNKYYKITQLGENNQYIFIASEPLGIEISNSDINEEYQKMQIEVSSILATFKIIDELEKIDINQEPSKKLNSAVDYVANQFDEQTLLIIFNNPTPSELENFRKEDILMKEFNPEKVADVEESILLFPRYNGMNFIVKSLVFEDNVLKDGEVVYEEKDTKDGFVLWAKISRPEGIPMYKMILEGNDVRAEYVVSYNGKTGMPIIEYILAD